MIDALYCRVDDLLRRTYTPDTPFGASGATVWAASPQGWGFPGDVHFVHLTGENGLAPLTFSLRADGEAIFPQDGLYRPSHVTLHAVGTDSGLQVTEDKFITADDVLVSVLSLRNPTDNAMSVAVDHVFGLFAGAHTFHGQRVFVYREGPPGDDLHFRLSGYATRTLVFAVGFGLDADTALRKVWHWRNTLDPTRKQAEEYQGWFDRYVPAFDCPDPYLTKMWYHHWYLMKKNHSAPFAGTMQTDTFAGGRWKNNALTATLAESAGNVLREVRWLRDPKFARNFFYSLLRNRASDGAFRSFFLDRTLPATGDTRAVWQAIVDGAKSVQTVHPDAAFLSEIAALRGPDNRPDNRGSDTALPNSAPLSVQDMADAANYLPLETLCRLQFENGDYLRPRTGTAYDADTLTWLTDDRDCLQSPFADRILTQFIGLVPRDDGKVEMHPNVPPSWDYFCVENVPYHGDLLTIVWDSPTYSDDAYNDGDKGLTVYRNGKRVHHQDDLEAFIV